MTIRDPFIKRVFAVCMGISFVLCSASLLVFSFDHINAAHATPKTEMNAPWDNELRGGVGLGIVKDTAYFVVWANPNNMFYKVELNKARNWFDK